MRADLGHGVVDEVGREVDAGDLGAERARDRQHLDAPVGDVPHGPLPVAELSGSENEINKF